MDKNSIQEYGWIVIIVIILSILIAFAAPFGKFIVASVQNAMNHFSQSVQDAIDAVAPLKTPKNLNVKNEVLTFEPVIKATGYTIKVGDGESFNVDATTIDISDELFGLEGEVVISVNAFNDVETGSVTKYVYLVPGLYATGSKYTDLITPWSELVANGVVTLDNGAVSAAGYDEDTMENISSAALAGDLALPTGGEVTSFADEAFLCCYNLTGITIPNTATKLGCYAIAYCTSITEITIPISVTFIDEDAFDYMYIGNVYYEGSLEEWCQIQFANANSNPCCDASLYCDGKLVTDVVLPKNTTSLSCTFAGCSSLTSIVIPNTITSIGNEEFEYCANLRSVTLPNTITSIGDEAFAYCFSLENLSIPDSVTTIGSDAFDYCPFTELTIPNGITSIEGYTFANCVELTTLTIPESITHIGKRALFGCSNLNKIVFKGSMEQWSDVVLEFEWDMYTNDFSVECIDGTIAEGNMLGAPDISITDDVLTITPTANAESYGIFVDAELKAVTTDLTFDLSMLGLEAGEHYINVNARASGYTPSAILFYNYWAAVPGKSILYAVE